MYRPEKRQRAPAGYHLQASPRRSFHAHALIALFGKGRVVRVARFPPMDPILHRWRCSPGSRCRIAVEMTATPPRHGISGRYLACDRRAINIPGRVGLEGSACATAAGSVSPVHGNHQLTDIAKQGFPLRSGPKCSAGQRWRVFAAECAHDQLIQQRAVPAAKRPTKNQDFFAESRPLRSDNFAFRSRYFLHVDPLPVQQRLGTKKHSHSEKSRREVRQIGDCPPGHDALGSHLLNSAVSRMRST